MNNSNCWPTIFHSSALTTKKKKDVRYQERVKYTPTEWFGKVNLLNVNMETGIEASNSSLKKSMHDVICDVTSSDDLLAKLWEVLRSSIFAIKLSLQLEQLMFTKNREKMMRNIIKMETSEIAYFSHDNKCNS